MAIFVVGLVGKRDHDQSFQHRRQLRVAGGRPDHAVKLGVDLDGLVETAKWMDW
ncbi:hypothetical protein JJB07_19545 [Tumebacillus sp. ITR2]|uniref:Uncharacterized protein n=1 Tax=Tumebacillus amylolyticus TaxID=2801339 RepID=A0ABS1JF13_9BACL|nr:hypothetical protein [Tumebacillus amylolyticus]MBL0388800.1 hypothetical protein [Tumebacillus amylolyticus]